MRKNVNICFQDETYKKIEYLVKRREISLFVNEAVEEKIQRREQEVSEQTKKEKERAELRKKMIAGYQENVKNQKLQKELEIWDRISGDGLDDE